MTRHADALLHWMVPRPRGRSVLGAKVTKRGCLGLARPWRTTCSNVRPQDARGQGTAAGGGGGRPAGGGCWRRRCTGQRPRRLSCCWRTRADAPCCGGAIDAAAARTRPAAAVFGVDGRASIGGADASAAAARAEAVACTPTSPPAPPPRERTGRSSGRPRERRLPRWWPSPASAMSDVLRTTMRRDDSRAGGGTLTACTAEARAGFAGGQCGCRPVRGGRGASAA